MRPRVPPGATVVTTCRTPLTQRTTLPKATLQQTVCASATARMGLCLHPCTVERISRGSPEPRRRAHVSRMGAGTHTPIFPV